MSLRARLSHPDPVHRADLGFGDGLDQQLDPCAGPDSVGRAT